MVKMQMPTGMARRNHFPFTLYQQAFAVPEQTEQAILTILQDAAFREALWIASPTLAQEAEVLLAHTGDFSEKRRKRILIGVARYLIRATTRPTPFGAFATVSPVTYTSDETDEAGSFHTYKEVRWDYEQIKKLSLNAKSFLLVNPTMTKLGDDYIQTVYPVDRCDNQTILLKTIFAEIQQPLLYEELLERLTPVYDKNMVYETVQTAVAKQYILLGNGTTFTHIPKAAPLQTYAQQPLGEGIVTLQGLLSQADYTFSTRQNVIHVDLIGSACKQTLPVDLLSNLDQAAHILAQWHPPTQQVYPLTDYANKFLEHYGEREVPFLDVILPTGIGLPPSPSYNPQTTDSTNLSTLISMALYQHAYEVDLPTRKVQRTLPPYADVVLMSTIDETGSPLYILGTEGFITPAGAVFGRFTAYHHTWQEYVQICSTRLEKEDCLVADLLFESLTPQDNNALFHAPVTDYQVTLDVLPDANHHYIPLSELLMGVSDKGLYLRWQRTGQLVILRVHHLLQRQSMPPIVQLLFDISYAHQPAIPTWDWREFTHMPFLPRVRVGSIVLSLARWTIPSTLQAPFSPKWQTQLSNWRNTWSVPRYIYVGECDMKLLLDLDHSWHQEILSRLIRQSNISYIEEVIGMDSDQVATKTDWVELILPLTISNNRDGHPYDCTKQLTKPMIENVQRNLIVGDENLSLHCYVHPNMMNTWLIQAADFLTASGYQNWFFIRYADPQPHLRLRVFAEKDKLVRLLPDWASIAKQWIQSGLLQTYTVMPYQREFERWGGIEGIHLCEALFCADSHAIVYALKHITLLPLDLREWGALCTDLFLTAAGLSLNERISIYEYVHLAYKEQVTGKVKSQLLYDLNRYFRGKRHILSRLLAPEEMFVAPYLIADIPLQQFLQVWNISENTLAKPLRSLASLEMWANLVHMHANRLGLNLTDEHFMVYSLYRTWKGVQHYQARKELDESANTPYR